MLGRDAYEPSWMRARDEGLRMRLDPPGLLRLPRDVLAGAPTQSVMRGVVVLLVHRRVWGESESTTVCSPASAGRLAASAKADSETVSHDAGPARACPFDDLPTRPGAVQCRACQGSGVERSGWPPPSRGVRTQWARRCSVCHGRTWRMCDACEGTGRVIRVVTRRRALREDDLRDVFVAGLPTELELFVRRSVDAVQRWPDALGVDLEQKVRATYRAAPTVAWPPYALGGADEAALRALAREQEGSESCEARVYAWPVLHLSYEGVGEVIVMANEDGALHVAGAVSG